MALATAISLLLMAILAPFAQFGVLKTLIVPADAAATTSNIAASLGLFQAAIVAFLIVAILDVVVAWGFYLLLRPVNERVARVVGSLRVVYAAAFAFADGVGAMTTFLVHVAPPSVDRLETKL